MRNPGRHPRGVGQPADAGFARMRPIADAVLYEGYLLYPYRRSSPKNRVRWQFGVLAPRAWAERNGPVAPGVAGSAESWHQRTECLVEAAGDAVLHTRVRYLQLQHKAVERRVPDGGYLPVPSLEVDGAIQLTFDEAVERETDLVVPLSELCAGAMTVQVGAPGGEDVEPLPAGNGRIVRRRHPVTAATTLSAEPLPGSFGRYRLRVHTENTGQQVTASTPRDEVLPYCLIATHTFLGGAGLAFCSLTDPPGWALAHARECRNLHTFPVRAGAPGSADLMLSAPIILPDHPRIAPESPGDLYDAAEIDEILSLRTMVLTDQEKREARATDQRAGRILDRVDAMSAGAFARLHGTVRSLRQASPAGPATDHHSPHPWWEEGGDDGLSPTTDAVRVNGVAVRGGSAVRLRPRQRGGDAHDMFLANRTASVAAVFHDVDGGVHLAVTVDDDPATDLHHWYGRYFYFRPDEVEPLTPTDQERAGGRHGAAEA